jgi:hypothetical protein
VLPKRRDLREVRDWREHRLQRRVSGAMNAKAPDSAKVAM